MPATFETLIDIVRQPRSLTPGAINPTTIAEALQDLLDRLTYLERSYLEQRFAQAQIDDRTVKMEQTLRDYDRDHVEVKQRLDAMEKQPAADAERLDAFEDRLRAVEGATGQRVKEERDLGHPDRPAQTDPLPVTTLTPDPMPVPPPPKPDKPDPQPTPASGPSDKQEREPAKANA